MPLIQACLLRRTACNFFYVLVYQAFHSITYLNDFSTQVKLCHSAFYISYRQDCNHIDHKYFIKMLVFFSSASFYNWYVHLHHLRFKTIQNSTPFSKMPLAPMTEHISTAALLQKCVRQLVIIKEASHRTAWLFVGLIWSFTIFFAGGMDQLQTQQCLMMLILQTSIFQQVSITLQMWDCQSARCLLFPNRMCVTTLQNGVMPSSSAFLLIQYHFNI